MLCANAIKLKHAESRTHSTVAVINRQYYMHENKFKKFTI